MEKKELIEDQKDFILKNGEKVIIDGKEVIIVDFYKEKINKWARNYYQKNKERVLEVQYKNKKKRMDENPEIRQKWNDYQKIYQKKYREMQKAKKEAQQKETS
jgi:hypothetical protein